MRRPGSCRTWSARCQRLGRREAIAWKLKSGVRALETESRAGPDQLDLFSMSSEFADDRPD